MSVEPGIPARDPLSIGLYHGHDSDTIQANYICSSNLHELANRMAVPDRLDHVLDVSHCLVQYSAMRHAVES